MPDFLFDLVYQPRRLFDPQPGAAAHMKPKLPGIHLGEKVPPQKEDQASGQDAEAQKAGDKNAPAAP